MNGRIVTIPAKKEYYAANRWVSRNILASNLGLIAKRGKEGSALFAVNDLKTTEPMPGVALELYNFQHQLIQTLDTKCKEKWK